MAFKPSIQMSLMPIQGQWQGRASIASVGNSTSGSRSSSYKGWGWSSPVFSSQIQVLPSNQGI